MKYELAFLEEYTDEALLAELRRVAASCDGQRLTRDRFTQLAKVHASTLSNRFGSWAAALDKAGVSEETAPRQKIITREDIVHALRAFVKANPDRSIAKHEIASSLGFHESTITRRIGKWEDLLSEIGLDPVPLGRRYTDEDCFENILQLWTHYGRQPVFGELKRAPSTVGPKAYIRRWGGWRAALTAFVRKVNDTTGHEQLVDSSSDVPKVDPEETVVPRSISLSLRYRVLVRDRFRCIICGASPAKELTADLHVDHIHPWSKGGQNTEQNLRTLCAKCNLGKGSTVEHGN